jgi:hypothetical protein
MSIIAFKTLISLDENLLNQFFQNAGIARKTSHLGRDSILIPYNQPAVCMTVSFEAGLNIFDVLFVVSVGQT